MMEQGEDGWKQKDNSYERGDLWFYGGEEPAWFEGTDGGKHGYFKQLQSGETGEYHIGYFVDEDQPSGMMLKLDGMSADTWYIDIRQ